MLLCHCNIKYVSFTVVLNVNSVNIFFRFELAIEFLSSTELDTLCNLFDKLEESLKSGQQDLAEQGVTEWTLSTLRRKYKV